MTKTIEQKMKNQPKRVKALIREYNGGRYGRTGEYIAIIEPYYFKNGNYKHQSFRTVKIIEIIKKGYGYGNCNHSEQIADILEIL